MSVDYVVPIAIAREDDKSHCSGISLSRSRRCIVVAQEMSSQELILTSPRIED